MGTESASTAYLSSGGNRQTAVADWNRSGLLAFGADTNVALWQAVERPQAGITKLLPGHKEQVKAVSFLPETESDSSSYLLTGGDDSTLLVWRTTPGDDNFEILQTSNEHKGAINCITTLRTPGSQPRWLVATGSADASIKIWTFEDDKLQLVQSVKSTPKYFPLSLSLAYLDADSEVVVLAAAGTRDTIQVLTANPKLSQFQFELQATLRGHEGWIRSLNFTKESLSLDSDLLLASASQDKYVRIWRFHQGQELPSFNAANADPSSQTFLPGKSPSNKAYWLKSSGKDFSVTFEALLLGHEDWIYSARWHTHADGKLQLLSTSADNSLAIWEADPGSGVWVSMVRLGEISREKGATTATGSTGGFWTGLWSPDGRAVACLGRTGSWRRWEYWAEHDAWRPCIAISGHTKAVTGVSWSKNGGYLLSTSSDQTTRLHMQWKDSGAGTWHEMSRPQIHGYDLNCIDSIGSTRFVSGADEKLMRVFSEPKAVATLLSRLGGIDEADVQDMPDAANMPVLGLSNKAIDAIDDDEEILPVDDRDREAVDPASVVKKSHLDIGHPPLEETLSRHTLWPETEKLYGHGYEISCLATSHDGKIIASACKASSTNHAVIRLFETDKWTELRPPLTAHSLTVTRLRFSADDRYLLSVGRDRQWAVFEKGEDSQYQLLQSNLKGHTRMILDACWGSSSTTPMFATAGRDKQARIWSSKPAEEGKVQFAQVAALPCSAPVTAVDILPSTVAGRCVLALGTEAGELKLFSISADGADVIGLSSVPSLNLSKSILQLSWRPTSDSDDLSSYELVIAGEDSSLRIYAFGQAYLVDGKAQ